MGQLLDIIRHERARDAGIARTIQRERDADYLAAVAEIEADYQAELADIRRASPSPRFAPPATSMRRTPGASAGEIRAKGAIITRNRNGVTIEGRHLTVLRRREIVRMVNAGATDAAIIDSLPTPSGIAPKERSTCTTTVHAD